MSDSYVVNHTEHGVTAFVGADAIDMYRAAQIKGGIKLWMSSKMILTRGMTISRLLGMAERYTGKKYRNTAAEHARAVSELETWISTMKSALPVLTEHPK